MAKSSERFESLCRDVGTLVRRLDVSSMLTMRSLPRHMRVEASAGRLEGTYPIGAGSRKSVHGDGAQPLYCKRVVDRNTPLHACDLCQETERASNEDEVESGLSSCLGYPVHTSGDILYGTVCVLGGRLCNYSAGERVLPEELRHKIEAPLAETVS